MAFLVFPHPALTNSLAFLSILFGYIDIVDTHASVTSLVSYKIFLLLT